MATTKESLQQIVTNLRSDLLLSFKQSKRYATGDTANKIEAIATDDQAQLTAPWWIYALQDGRKPTSPTGPYMEGPTLLSQIKLWCKAKGIKDNLAYAITQHIHKFGYPGTPGIIDKPLSDANVSKAMKKSLQDLAVLFQNDISNSILIPAPMAAVTPEPQTVPA